MKVLLRKHKENEDIRFTPVYFNSTTKTIINSKYMFDKPFQEILYRINHWINEGSGWAIESIDADYVNISTYNPLSANSYTEFPNKLKNLIKALINIKNNDNKCFLGCHTRYLNPLKKTS